MLCRMTGTMEKLLQKAKSLFGRGKKASRQLSPGGFLETTGDEVPRALRYDRPLGLIMVMVDGLAMVRKADGAEAANEVFQAVAGLFEDMMRSPDRVGRLGMGEIGILLPETNLSNAAAVAERLRRAAEALTIETQAGPKKATVSVGVVALTPRLRDPKSFLMRGAFELRRARSYGGNRVCVASPEKVRLTVPRNAQIH